jgi:Amt family ammonium transporter
LRGAWAHSSRSARCRAWAPAIGLLAHPDAPIGETGLLYGGSPALLGKQAVALLATCAETFTFTFLIAKVLDRTIGIRVTEEQEKRGLDSALHAENAYEDAGVLAQYPRGHAEREHHLDVDLGLEAEPIRRG